MDNLVIPRAELAILSTNSSYGRDISNVVFDPDQIIFPGNVENLSTTISSRLNSNADLNAIDETRGITTVEVGDLSVSERNFARRTHTHHSNSFQLWLNFGYVSIIKTLRMTQKCYSLC